MAVIQHSAISDAELHQPKGASTAVVNSTIKSNGAGATSWSKIAPPNLTGLTTNGNVGEQLEVDGAGGWVLKKHPFGSCFFENIAAPYVLTYPAAYTKAAVTTTASGLGNLVTEGTNARLTYLGTGEVMDVTVTLSLSQSTAADRDIRVSIYKNGAKVNGSVGILTTVSGQKRFISTSAVVSLATNDYIECYLQNDGVSGDITIYTFSLFLDPH